MNGIIDPLIDCSEVKGLIPNIHDYFLAQVYSTTHARCDTTHRIDMR